MRVSFVSDIHGNIDGLAEVARNAETLVVLGDLLDYVDYHDPSAGILGEVFGAEKVQAFTELRSSGDFAALHRLNSGLWASIADPVGTVNEVVDRRYRQAFQALTLADRTPLLILGNVDVMDVWERVAGDELPSLDGSVVQVHGFRFGFVGGGASRVRPAPGFAMPSPMPSPVTSSETSPASPVPNIARAWRPYVREAAEYSAAVAALGAVDVLCSHLPPNLAPLRYDMVPARLEMYGPGLLESVDAHHPWLAVFGHVHQPLASRMRRGGTECVNVGHFARRPLTFDIQL